MKKRVTIGALLMAFLMLAGCRPSTDPSEATETDATTQGKTEIINARTEAETDPPEMIDRGLRSQLWKR